MFLERVTSKGMAGNKFWYSKAWNKGAGTENGLANCTCFCVGAINESASVDNGITAPLSLFQPPYQSGGAFPDAKSWFTMWKGKKGSEPKVGGVCVWDGARGHVAYVLETKDAGTKGAWVKVAQSNYKGAYFEMKEYYVKVGKTTEGVELKYIGCVYNDVRDMRVDRDEDHLQVKVLTDSLNVRMTPNGVVYSGRRCPKGIYNIYDRVKAGSYTWAQLDRDCWIALNDKDGWTKTYEIADCETRYRSLMNAYTILSEKYSELLVKYKKETGKEP